VSTGKYRHLYSAQAVRLFDERTTSFGASVTSRNSATSQIRTFTNNYFESLKYHTFYFYVHTVHFFFFPGAAQPILGVYFTALYRALASSRTRLLDHTQRRATVGRTTLNELSVSRRDLYLTTHNTHNRQTSMHRVGFESTVAAGERP
jgi:hypothetical protein